MTITEWDRLGGRAQAALCGVLFFALALAFVLGVFLYPENFLTVGWDYQSHQFFLKTFLAESFRAGELPLWIPYICAGRPFAADPQTGVFYPLNLLYAVLPVPAALTVLIFIHMAAAGLSCCLLARQIGLGGFASLVSGVIFMWNGFLVSHAYRGQSERVEALAYLPLILLLIERAERTGRLRWYVWGGVAGALQFLAGAPQIAWMTWVGVGVYVLARRACFWKDGKLHRLGRSVVGGLVALAVTAGLAAIQIVPTVELVLHSNRAERSLEFSGAFSFPLENLIHIFFPNYSIAPGVGFLETNPETSGYVGEIGIVLAGLGLLCSERRLKWAFCAIAVLSAFIMLGPATPVFTLLYHAVPGLSAFRIHSRAIVMVSLCLAVWAGMGADTMWSRTDRARSRLTGLALTLALLVIMGMTAPGLDRFLDSGIGQVPALWSALALAGLALVGVGLGGVLRREWVRPVFLGIICFDLFYVGASMSSYRRVEKAQCRPPASERAVLARMRQDEGLFRFALPRELVRENFGVLAHVSGVNGFISLSLDRYYRFVHEMRSQSVPTERTHTPAGKVFHPDNSFPFKVLNVRYSVGRDPRTGELTLVSRDNYPPRAFLASRFEVKNDGDAVLRAIKDPAFDPLDVVLFEKDPGVPFSPGPPDAENRVRVVQYGSRTIVLEAALQSDAFLVLSEVDYPGWRAYVDGEEVRIHRADYLLRAIPLRAGHYDRIVFRYVPRSFSIGLLITVGSALGTAAVLVLSAVRRPAARPSPVEQLRCGAGGASVITGRDWRLWTRIIAVIGAGLALPLLLRTTFADGWAEVGDYLVKQGRLPAAVSAFNRALERDPDLAEAHSGMGYALAQQGQLEQAADHLRRAIEAAPASYNAHNLLGHILTRQGRLEEAVKHCRRATELKPDFAQAHYNWGEALVALGRFDEAGEQFGRAQQLSAGEPELYLGVAAIWAGNGRFASAVDVLRDGRERLPDNLDIVDALAWLLAACPQADLRDGPAAVALATRACEGTAHRNPFMLRTLAAAYAQTGQWRPALDVARKALELATQRGHRELAGQLADMIDDFMRRRDAGP